MAHLIVARLCVKLTAFPNFRLPRQPPGTTPGVIGTREDGRNVMKTLWMSTPYG